jgi:hypothetical protein
VCPTTRGVIHHQAVGGGFLRFEDFRKLLDDNPGLKRIELSNWGEIFLNPALLSVLELAHERGVELTAHNGVGFFTSLNSQPNYSPVRDPEAVRAATDAPGHTG